MYKEELLQKALFICVDAHKEQYDKGGQPYAYHPIRISQKFNDVDLRIISLLHDVVEDSNGTYTLESLSKEFNESIIESIDSITKRNGEDYESYIVRVSKDFQSTLVKIEDITDNLNLSRLLDPTSISHKKIDRYIRALNLLRCT